jgi:hypothetical protein
MLSFGSKEFQPYEWLVGEDISLPEIDTLIEKANSFTLTKEDLTELNTLFKDLFCIYHLNETYLKYIKEVSEYLEDPRFGELVDGEDLEKNAPQLFNELLMSRIISASIVENSQTLTSSIGIMTQIGVKILKALEKLIHEKPPEDHQVPEQIAQTLSLLFSDDTIENAPTSCEEKCQN